MVVTRSQSRLIADSSTSDSTGHEELLGRGCRHSRVKYSLDEQYLRESPHFFAKKHVRCASPERGEPHSRYPQRDAAKRALSSLKNTMKVLDDGSNPESEFHFTHHPPSLQEEERSSSSDSSSSSSTDSSRRNDIGRKREHEYSSEGKGVENSGPKEIQYGGKATVSGRYFSSHQKENSEESVISISDSSLRQDSDSGEEKKSESEDSDSISEDCETENPKELYRKANAKAKESVARNIDINHYMADAIEKPLNRNQKKREIDRRYRHLFIADKKEKKELSSQTGGVEGSGSLGDVSPLSIDPSIRFESVGGLPQHIVILREMVLFPLLYPELLHQFHLRPPRGVLFVGPPGTGKTLLARALANEGKTAHGCPITFFMRKGADILSKWVGESERQLSLLFEEAKAKKPSIIFFDEIDGLAPIRHSKTEQSHAALVSTFLALMDGLDDRGQVVIIGATNRPDTIDPALRRPGRFDRDLLFPYPNKAARKHVLSIVAKGILSSPTVAAPSEEDKSEMDALQPQHDNLIDELADMTEGFSGADLKALCVEAGLNRLRMSFPQLYATSERLALPPLNSFRVSKEDFFVAIRRIQPSSSRTSIDMHCHLLEEHWNYLLGEVREGVLVKLSQLWPSVSPVLREEAVDCADIDAAVRQLYSFPVPIEKNLFMLFLEAPPLAQPDGELETTHAEVCTFLAFSLIKRLPSYRSLIVHMNHIQIDFDSKATEQFVAASDVFTHGHLFDLVCFLRRSAPCILILQGVEEWWEVQKWSKACEEGLSEDAVSLGGRNQFSMAQRAWCYYMNLLAKSEVIIIVPCSSSSTDLRSFLGLSSSFSPPRAQHSLEMRCSIPWTAVEVPLKPSRSQLTVFVQYILRIFYTSLFFQEQPRTLEVELKESNFIGSSSALDSTVHPKNSAEMEEALKLWRKVEFRRLQLRHILSKWMNQYITSGKYKCFLSADLDFSPNDEILKDWQKCTSDSRIGLHDILDKVEHHKYVCLSQYHDDIDMLVRNVRSFFRSRSSTDTKYRLKALDLKENTVLGLYKVNRHLVHFCEEHKDVSEPLHLPQEQASAAAPKQISLPSRSGNQTYSQKLHKISWGRRRKRKKRKLERLALATVDEIQPKDESSTLELGESNSKDEAKEAEGVPSEVLVAFDETSSPSSVEGVDDKIVYVVQLLESYGFLELHKFFFRVMNLLHVEAARSSHDERLESQKRAYRTREEILLFFCNCVTESVAL